jgi:hypothetical protein
MRTPGLKGDSLFETILIWRYEPYGASLPSALHHGRAHRGVVLLNGNLRGAAWGSPEMLCDAMQQLLEEIRASEKRFATA